MNDGQFPNVVHGSHANGGEMEYTRVSLIDFEKVTKHFGGESSLFPIMKDGSHLGHARLVDWDEDRYYYDYFVLTNLYERFLKETA